MKFVGNLFNIMQDNCKTVKSAKNGEKSRKSKKDSELFELFGLDFLFGVSNSRLRESSPEKIEICCCLTFLQI